MIVITRMIKSRHFFNLLITSILFGSLLAGCISLASQPVVLAALIPPPLPTRLKIEAASLAKATDLVEKASASPIPTSTPIPTPTHFTPAPSETPIGSTVEPPQLEAYAYGPSDFPLNINPLTGLPVANPEFLARRPIAIKVTNFPRSVRPQWGLTLADQVYEYYIGDNMSRFIGIFYSTDASRVGPVRSARLFDEHIMRMYNAIFVFGWADDPVLEFLLQPDLLPYLLVERAEGNCPPLCRIGPEYAYNTLFVDTSQISSYLTERGTDNQRQNLDGLRFELSTPTGGHPGEQLTIQFSSISYNHWGYEHLQGRYSRLQETSADIGQGKTYEPLTDNLTGEQIYASNVVILKVPHEYYYKSSSTEIIDQLLLGEGSGYAFRDGQLYPITWRQERVDQLVTLWLPNGNPYPLKPGNTWFEVIGASSSLTQQAENAWGIEFGFP